MDGDNHMYRTQETKKFGDINSTDGFKNNNIVQISESVAWKVLEEVRINGKILKYILFGSADMVFLQPYTKCIFVVVAVVFL